MGGDALLRAGGALLRLPCANPRKSLEILGVGATQRASSRLAASKQPSSSQPAASQPAASPQAAWSTTMVLLSCTTALHNAFSCIFIVFFYISWPGRGGRVIKAPRANLSKYGKIFGKGAAQPAAACQPARSHSATIQQPASSQQPASRQLGTPRQSLELFRFF